MSQIDESGSDGLDPVRDPDSNHLDRYSPLASPAVPLYGLPHGDALVFATFPIGLREAAEIRGGAERAEGVKGPWLAGEDPWLGISFPKVKAGLLRDFVALHSASDHAILKFALARGPLRLCAHGLPHEHWRHPIEINSEAGITPCRPLGNGRRSWWEPLAGWRALSGCARSMLRLASSLRQEIKGDRADWEVVLGSPGAFPPGDSDLLSAVNPKFQMAMLVLQVQRWLDIGMVGPIIRTRDGLPYVRIGGAGMFSGVALQLMLAVAGTKGVAFCVECGKLYDLKRRPNPGDQTYCMRCQRLKASRGRAGHKWRSAHRDGQRLLRERRPVAEVASRVGSKIETVERWAAKIRGEIVERSLVGDGDQPKDSQAQGASAASPRPKPRQRRASKGGDGR
jgi:hypothetical protein